MRNLYELREQLEIQSNKVKKETKRLERRYFKHVPLFIGLLLLVFVTLTLNRVQADYKEADVKRSAEIEKTQQNYDSLEKKYEKLLKLQQQQREDLEKRIEDLSVAKQERIRLASIQSNRPKPVQRVLGGCEQYRGLVSQYAWNADTALAVMKAESGCNPTAANWTDNHGVCRGSFGLMQISCHSGQVFDPAQNVAIAYQKYTARGWQPWLNTARKLGIL